MMVNPNSNNPNSTNNSQQQSSSNQALEFDNLDKEKKIAFLAQDLLNDLKRFSDSGGGDEGCSSNSNNSPQIDQSANCSSNAAASTSNAENIPNYIDMFGDLPSNGVVVDRKPKTANVEETTKKRKRRSNNVKGSSGGGNKPKRKAKTQYQRKNIKKVFNENQLNEATLKALQAEQERQQRLMQDPYSMLSNIIKSESNIDDETGDIIKESEEEEDDDDEDEEDEEEEDSAEESESESEKDTSIQLIDHESGIKTEIKKQPIEEDDDDIIPISSDYYQSSVATSSRQNRVGSNRRNTPFNNYQLKPLPPPIEDSDDDCRILSDAELLQDQQQKKQTPRGIHMTDELNVPDAEGRVLVNVNHLPNEPDVFLLPFLAKNIKSHQIGGIRFMFDNIVENLERVKDKASGFGCILAHAMGLGKTFQVISFVEVFLRCTVGKRVLCIVPINTIQNWVSEFNCWLPENGQQKFDNDTILNYQRPFKVHVINDCAKTLNQRTDIILEWKKNGGVLLIGYEMFRALVTLKNVDGGIQKQKKKATTAASTPNLHKYFQTPSQQQQQNATNPCSPQVPITIDLDDDEQSSGSSSNGGANNDQQSNKLSEIEEALLNPCLVVCDEGHRIKNSLAGIAKALKKINTKRRIVLTGYPLQNNLIEYWCMVDFVRPSYLGTKSEFSNMFERPIMNGQCMDSTREDIKLMRYRAHVLHSLLEGFVQRRGHDVFLATLPKKHEYIILLKLSPIQKELYLAFMEAIGAMNPGEKSNPLRTFAICCKIWNHPDVLHKLHLSKDNGVEMDLDLPELNGCSTNQQQQQQQQSKKSQPSIKRSASKGCNLDESSNSGGFNPFGNEAARRAAALASCAGFNPDWANRFMEGYVSGLLQNGAKFSMAFDIIAESVRNRDKILLFSQSLLSLNLIEEYLQRIDVPNCPGEKWQKYKSYYRLDGSTSGCEREKLINGFNKPNSGVWLFLLSTRAGCLGINLIGANRVIVLDASWNPCHDAQAVCRVYRYRQTKNCYIYRLIADHTMEKKIYDRQISKQTMSDRVIDEIQSENHFTRTEVEKLIHYVKEDTPAADLSEMESKFEDKVLVRACMHHANVITREPFTHESLLIDKKEYQLSAREKEIAFRDYNYDRRYFPCSAVGLSSRATYASASCSILPPTTSGLHSRFMPPPMPPPPSMSQPHRLHFSHTPNHNNTYNNIGHSASMYNLVNNSNGSHYQATSQRPMSHSQPVVQQLQQQQQYQQQSGVYNNAANVYNHVNSASNHNGYSNLDFNLLQTSGENVHQQPQQQQQQINLNPPANTITNQTRPQENFAFNIQQQQQSQTQQAQPQQTAQTIPNNIGLDAHQILQQQSHQDQFPTTSGPNLSPNHLKDIKISSFTANSAISIPIAAPSSDSNINGSNNNSILIQPGEKVYILKTPRGCYLRTPDKRYIALRSRSLEDSIWNNSSHHPEPQLQQQQQPTTSYQQQNFYYPPQTNEQPIDLLSSQQQTFVVSQTVNQLEPTQHQQEQQSENINFQQFI